jgi:hypothetical protein
VILDDAGEIAMRAIWIPIGTLCLLGAGFTLALAQPAGRNPPACVQIRVACQKAGFAAGARSEGTGLVADCMVPIMQGAPQRPRASKPLPQVDSQLVGLQGRQSQLRSGGPSPAADARGSTDDTREPRAEDCASGSGERGKAPQHRIRPY